MLKSGRARHGQNAVPDAVFHVGLKHHRGDLHRMGVHFRGDANAVLEFVFEAHVLQHQVQFQAGKFLGQGGGVVLAGVQVLADQLREAGEVLVRHGPVLAVDAVLDAVQRVEDEVPVHVRVQRLLLKLEHTGAEDEVVGFFSALAADLPIAHHAQQDPCEDRRAQGEEPPPEPERRGDGEVH